MNIRRARPGDAAQLAELAERTFRETFAKDNRAEDLEAYVRLAYGTERQRREIEDPRHVALLAEEDGALIAAGTGGAAARLDGRKPWSIHGHGDAVSFALLRRGVLLLQRDGTELYDAGEGLQVGRLPAARDAALGEDLSCVLLHDGAVSVHRLTTHLSLV